jgi:hypothetical protein
MVQQHLREKSGNVEDVLFFADLASPLFSFVLLFSC